MHMFYSAKWESIFLLYINNWTTTEISNNYTMLVTMLTYTKLNVAFKTAKPFWKIWKYKINIFYKTNLKAKRKGHSTW